MTSSPATPSLDLPLLAPAQARKYLTVNEALLSLDTLTQLSVLSADLADRPSDPPEGSSYLSGPESAWGVPHGTIERWVNGAWRSTSPLPGWIAWVESEARHRVFSGTDWEPLLPETAAIPDVLDNLDRLGVSTGADTYNRLSVKSPGVLLSSPDPVSGATSAQEIRVAVNAETGGAAAIQFQQDYATQAEIGVFGTEDLRIRVPDMQGDFQEALSVTSGSGHVCVGEGAAVSRVTIAGPDDPESGPVLRLCGKAANQFESGRIRFTEDANGLTGAYIHYDGSSNFLSIGTHDYGTDGDPVHDNPGIQMIRGASAVYFPGATTTAQAANAVLLTGQARPNLLARSTSSLRYKHDVEPLDLEKARKLLDVAPIWYRSRCSQDDPTHSFYGFGAEDVAEVDPRLVLWSDDPNGGKRPESVAYDRFTAIHHALLRDLVERVEALEASIQTT